MSVSASFDTIADVPSLELSSTIKISAEGIGLTDVLNQRFNVLGFVERADTDQNFRLVDF